MTTAVKFIYVLLMLKLCMGYPRGPQPKHLKVHGFKHGHPHIRQFGPEHAHFMAKMKHILLPPKGMLPIELADLPSEMFPDWDALDNLVQHVHENVPPIVLLNILKERQHLIRKLNANVYDIHNAVYKGVSGIGGARNMGVPHNRYPSSVEGTLSSGDPYDAYAMNFHSSLLPAGSSTVNRSTDPNSSVPNGNIPSSGLLNFISLQRGSTLNPESKQVTKDSSNKTGSKQSVKGIGSDLSKPGSLTGALKGTDTKGIPVSLDMINDIVSSSSNIMSPTLDINSNNQSTSNTLKNGDLSLDLVPVNSSKGTALIDNGFQVITVGMGKTDKHIVDRAPVKSYNPFLTRLKPEAFGPGPYYECTPPSRVICGARVGWDHVIGMSDWCKKNCVVFSYSSYCDDDRCRCKCVSNEINKT